ncbi:type IV toxin-antitoxin system YeeU family antitoxin [Kineosporia sp. NBRC 101731]|uniref:type IV toxin-antitoxin system YeeU family antitoxin n=1 Tax=Kineosporia sp. NBRC 101731 TaxID=3032199 RepID=UPI0024A45D26|nr:type IV toxin-antitoxin system YeeU family antitoxin [Kineosporia sp. NBRC 101731]GLY33436.1 hypothetical protein Kisp02_68010 [Kineosporia sp. NBRC 101731]
MSVTARFALKNVAPDNALSIWGARLNVDRTGYVDLPPDRFGSDDGPYSAALTNLINWRYPIDAMRESVSHLLTEGTLSPAESRDVILYLDEQLTVHADSRSSHGYVYITAWLTQARTTLILDPGTVSPAELAAETLRNIKAYPSIASLMAERPDLAHSFQRLSTDKAIASRSWDRWAREAAGLVFQDCPDTTTPVLPVDPTKTHHASPSGYGVRCMEYQLPIFTSPTSRALVLKQRSDWNIDCPWCLQTKPDWT